MPKPPQEQKPKTTGNQATGSIGAQRTRQPENPQLGGPNIAQLAQHRQEPWTVEELTPQGYQWTPQGLLWLQGQVNRPIYPRPRAYNQQPPVSDAPGANFGAPPDWDWRTSPLGWNNEPLPNGAVGWTPRGEPYFGDGIGGWFKKLAHKLSPGSYEPVQLTQEDIPNLWAATHEGAEPESVAGYLGDIGKVFSAAWNNLKAGYAGDQKYPTVFGAASRLTSTTVVGAFDIVQQFADTYEGLLGTLALNLEDAGANSPLPSIDQIIGQSETTSDKWYGKLASFLTHIAPPVIAYHAVRALVAPRLTGDEARDIFVRNKEASRMAYTAFGNHAVWEEFKRGIAAGDNPTLLAMELEDPLLEFTGQLLLDPLNFFGAVIKPLKASRGIASAAEEFINLAPDIAKTVERLGLSADDALRIERIGDVAESVSTAVKKTSSGLDELAKSFGLHQLTTLGKRNQVMRRASDVGRWITSTASTPDEAIEMFRAMALMASGEVDDVANALATITHFPSPQPMLSRAGLELGQVMRSMLLNADGELDAAGFLRKLGDVQNLPRGEQIEKLVDTYESAVRPVVDDMFPTLLERADRGEQIPEVYQVLARFDKFAKNKVYSRVNSFFAGLYMGMNPGYVARNTFNNVFTVLTDYGPGAFKMGPQKWLAEQARWLGDVLATGAELGFKGAASSAETPTRGLWTAMLGASEAIEKKAAAAITGYSVRQTMTRMLVPGRALPDMRPLIELGMHQDTARWLSRLVVDNYGDMGAVRKLFTEAVSTGSVDVARAMEHLSEDTIGKLRDFELLDSIRLGLQGSWDEFEKAVDDLKNVTAEFGGLSADEMTMLSEELADVGVIAVDEAARLGEVSQDVAQMMRTRVQVNGDLVSAWEQLAKRHLFNVERIANTSGNQPVLEAITALLGKQEYTRLFPEGPYATALAQWRDVVQPPMYQLGEDISRADVAEFANLWDKMFPGTPIPEGITRKQLRNAWWNDFYVPKSNKFFDDAADASVLVYNRFIDELSAVAGAKPEGTEFQKAITALRNAEELRTAKILDGKLVIEEAAQAAPEAAQAAPTLRQIPFPHNPDGVPSLPHAINEQAADIIRLLDEVQNSTRAHWGARRPITSLSPELETALNDWFATAGRRVPEARLIATQVANAARDFTLLDYNKRRNIDLLLAYVYPYHFWHSRTYANWINRMVTNPAVIAGYAKYKDMLENIHAGAPDWWKYSINTNELLGLNSANPLFFNLEKTLWPLEGLTGVDFEDPYKRTGWFTAALQDINRFGPSTWSPLNYATALALTMRGEEEAAARWGSRLVPQTATLKSLASVLGFGGSVETDPAVWLFAGGMDPYERRRVGRALGAMVEEGQITQEQAIDAANAQAGPLWQSARDREAKERAPGQLSSFFLSASFRPRSAADLQIDQFYNEYFSVWNMADNLAPEELRTQLDELRNAYPFMDTVLLANKGAENRDRTFAYTVLSRIPPGQSSEIMRAANISQELSDQFYGDKGDMNAWPEGDRLQFMGGIANIAALLAVPDNATRTEWRDAKNAYADMRTQLAGQFGDDIWDKIDAYYSYKDGTPAGRDRANAYLDAHPEVSDALDAKSQSIILNRSLYRYYGGLSAIESFYEGQMYKEIEATLGADIWDKWDEYWRMKEEGQSTTAFWRAYPELKEYGNIKDKWEAFIEEAVGNAGDLLRDTPAIPIRGDIPPSQTQQQMLQELQPQQVDWQAAMQPHLWRLTEDFILLGEQLPKAAKDALTELAEAYGMSFAMLKAELTNYMQPQYTR